MLGDIEPKRLLPGVAGKWKSQVLETSPTGYKTSSTCTRLDPSRVAQHQGKHFKMFQNMYDDLPVMSTEVLALRKLLWDSEGQHLIFNPMRRPFAARSDALATCLATPENTGRPAQYVSAYRGSADHEAAGLLPDPDPDSKHGRVLAQLVV
ncbi:hypothetical protein HPB52_006469 [Rhipicephalus sanguineus]|uniref:Uncharacterized protein n=1 Tax=Rhipicephalus sanguineus TaxID=34632 RepID=A0A9D4PBS7_RHISA|nr:hypothetical protein HPB52_006469 [Rhipicephalus sanguineus]